MNKIVLVINLEKKNVLDITEKTVHWLEQRKVKVEIKKIGSRELAAGDLNLGGYQSEERPDCIMVLGGDGTILSCARAVAKLDIPIFGVNLGHLGFLTEIEVHDIIPAFQKLLANDYYIEERMMIEAKVHRDGKIVEKSIGLNDAVITKGAFARLINLEIYVNEQHFSTYPADGLIIASPTGSTAYSLSAGGPLVPPNLELMLITPICPHTLTSRPLVISSENTVKIRMLSYQMETMLTLDGQHGFQLNQGDEIIINKAAYRAKFVKLNDITFFSLVRKKLREGRDIDV